MIKNLIKTTLLTPTLASSATDNFTGWYYNQNTTGRQCYEQGKQEHDHLLQ